ncbi:MAG: hypothetical protein WC916_01145 [Candidatus Woesearchaeota archaeon]
MTKMQNNPQEQRQVEVAVEELHDAELYKAVLDKYAIAPMRPDEQILRNIDCQLIEISKSPLAMESKAIEELQYARILQTYPKLDTSFLKMTRKMWMPSFDNIPQSEHNMIKYGSEITFDKDGKANHPSTLVPIYIPLFGIFPLDDDTFMLDFTIKHTLKGKYTINHDTIYNLTHNGFYHRGELISSMVDTLLDSIHLEEFKSKQRFFRGYTDPEEKKQEKLYRHMCSSESFEREHIFATKISGIVPEHAKQKLEKAKNLFNTNELYIIKEIMPNEWQYTMFPNGALHGYDPLVIGTKKDTAFFITDFNTTPLEDIIKRGYAENN